MSRLRIINSLFSLLLVFLLLSACRSITPARQHPNIRGIDLKMQEVAKDGKFDIYPGDKFCKVDANSTLKLSFETPPEPEDLEASPEWQTLSDALARLNETGKKYEKLAERARELVSKNIPHDPVFTEEVDEASKEAVTILKLLVEPPSGVAILTRRELSDLMAARYDEPYSALVEVLNEQRSKLHERAVRFAQDAQEYEVKLRAFLLPKGGQRQALHIPGYDNLPQGDFRPLDPRGLLPTPEERRRIVGELEAARKVSSSIREIRRNGNTLLESIERLFRDIEDSMERLESEIRSELLNKLPGNWEDLLDDNFLDRIGRIETPGDESSIIRNEFKEIRLDLDALKKAMDLIQDLRGRVKKLFAPGGVPFTEIEVIIKDIEILVGAIKNLASRITEWKVRLPRLNDAFPAVIEAVVDETAKEHAKVLKTELSAALEGSQKWFEEKLPETAGAFELILKFYKDTKIGDGTKSMLALGAEEPIYIPHPLEDLKTAELDLRYTGISVGDQISFTVDILPKDMEESETYIKLPAVVYNAEATLAGWHKRYDSNVIFSRTLKGPASSAFRSNVGLALEWHYFDRKAPNSFFNKLDPGFGFHAVFLDQDIDENIEMGGGINFSILNGLVRVGLGYNISAEKDNTYWFIGFGLFNMLGKLGDLGEKIF